MSMSGQGLSRSCTLSPWDTDQALACPPAQAMILQEKDLWVVHNLVPFHFAGGVLPLGVYLKCSVKAEMCFRGKIELQKEIHTVLAIHTMLMINNVLTKSSWEKQAPHMHGLVDRMVLQAPKIPKNLS